VIVSTNLAQRRHSAAFGHGESGQKRRRARCFVPLSERRTHSSAALRRTKGIRPVSQPLREHAGVPFCDEMHSVGLLRCRNEELYFHFTHKFAEADAVAHEKTPLLSDPDRARGLLRLAVAETAVHAR